LRWTSDGEPQALTSRDRGVVAEKKLSLLGGSRTKSYIKALPKRFNGSATAYTQAISKATVALSQAAASSDEPAMQIIRRYVAGLKDMAGAIVPHAGYLDLEEDHDKLLQYVEDLHAGKAVIEGAEKSKASDRSIATLEGRTRSGEAPN